MKIEKIIDADSLQETRFGNRRIINSSDIIIAEEVKTEKNASEIIYA